MNEEQERILTMDIMLNDLRNEARDKFVKDLYRQKLSLQCQMGTAPNYVQTLYNDVNNLRSSLPLNSQTDTYGYWICVNPPDTLPLQTFIEAGKKCQTKVWIDSFCWVIEQRAMSLDEAGKGFHYHCLITAIRGKKHNQIIREIANTFKHITDTSNYHFFSVKAINEDEYKRKLKYIAGYKNSEDKIIKQRVDVIFRERNNIPKTYHSTDFDFQGCYENII